MIRITLFILILLMACKLHAQRIYRLNPPKIQLGKVENWKNDTIWFELSNIGDKPWFILPRHHGREYQLLHSRETIPPGSAARLGVIYYTEEKGPFKLNIPVYINSLNEPIELKISGQIRTIDPNALVQCPTVNRPPSVPATAVLAQTQRTEDRAEAEKKGVKDEKDTYSFEDSFIEEEPVGQEQALEVRNETVDDPDAFAPSAPPNNIVLLLDKSRSMGANGKMASLQSAVAKLINALRPQDQITIITYSRVVKVPLLADDKASKERMLQIVYQLSAEGGSYGGKGMMKAFDLAKKYRLPEGNNAIILATDGKFNDREITENDLFKEAQRHSRRGIKVSGLAFGDDPRAVNFLKSLSENGRGQCIEVQKVSDSERMILKMVKDLSYIE